MKVNEIRYPCSMGEMTFKVSSVGGNFEKYTLVCGHLQDLQNWVSSKHLDKDNDPYEVIINFTNMEIYVHDDYMY